MAETFDQMNQETGAFDMPQKLHPEPCARMRPFDQTRNVGHDKGFSAPSGLTTPRFGVSVVNG